MSSPHRPGVKVDDPGAFREPAEPTWPGCRDCGVTLPSYSIATGRCPSCEPIETWRWRMYEVTPHPDPALERTRMVRSILGLQARTPEEAFALTRQSNPEVGFLRAHQFTSHGMKVHDQEAP